MGGNGRRPTPPLRPPRVRTPHHGDYRGGILPLQTGALQKAGYRRTHSEPVFVSDPGSLLGDRNDLAVSLLENDGYYWSGNGG
jgi:hypothetical protein